MIHPTLAQTLARYNRWQNRSLYGAADGLSDAERRNDRGAFFKSIHGTLSHILWGDAMWMSRVSDAPKPNLSLSESADFCADWIAMKQQRADRDERLVAWADGLNESWFRGDLSWRSEALNRRLVKPRWLIVVHMFNHQTHHRGQVHAMLTAAGARPEDTDLPFAPPSAGVLLES